MGDSRVSRDRFVYVKSLGGARVQRLNEAGFDPIPRGAQLVRLQSGFAHSRVLYWQAEPDRSREAGFLALRYRQGWVANANITEAQPSIDEFSINELAAILYYEIERIVYGMEVIGELDQFSLSYCCLDYLRRCLKTLEYEDFSAISEYIRQYHSKFYGVSAEMLPIEELERFITDSIPYAEWLSKGARTTPPHAKSDVYVLKAGLAWMHSHIPQPVIQEYMPPASARAKRSIFADPSGEQYIFHDIMTDLEGETGAVLAYYENAGPELGRNDKGIIVYDLPILKGLYHFTDKYGDIDTPDDLAKIEAIRAGAIIMPDGVRQLQADSLFSSSIGVNAQFGPLHILPWHTVLVHELGQFTDVCANSHAHDGHIDPQDAELVLSYFSGPNRDETLLEITMDMVNKLNCSLNMYNVIVLAIFMSWAMKDPPR